MLYLEQKDIRGEKTMLLCEGHARLINYVNRPFKNFLTREQLQNIEGSNKGAFGQILEILLGLQNTPAHLDFEDGELKTNKCDSLGNPLETIAITQIGATIDELLGQTPFEQSGLYSKIQNMLIVLVSKDDPDIGNWKICRCKHIDLRIDRYENLKNTLGGDYELIRRQLRASLLNDVNAMLHTTNGALLQIRTKDSGEYHPIYSQRLHRFVSNKGFAFYFKKDFVINWV